jgi:NADPH:quinone reductase-like Zn-dependent oxidoreductase
MLAAVPEPVAPGTVSLVDGGTSAHPDAQPGDAVKLPRGEVVIKPAVGAGSIDTFRFSSADAARAHATRLLESGRSVLVHAGSGGVGQAAAQLVTALGCIALSTAGSERKRLATRALGLPCVGGSRSVAFADLVVQATRGRGVGGVLNTLTSAGMLAASLSVLAAGGQLLEISKRDVWSGSRCAQERADLQQRLIAVDFLPAPTAGAALLQLARALAVGAARPLGGCIYRLGAARSALRQMAAARHVGKVVTRVASPTARLCDGAALLTGGMMSVLFVASASAKARMVTPQPRPGCCARRLARRRRVARSRQQASTA